MLQLSSCQAKKSETPAESTQSQAAESQIESETPSESESDPEEAMYAALAQLTKEDGTGEISLDMTVAEIIEVLDRHGIEYGDYSLDGEGSAGYITVRKNIYHTFHYYKYGSFAVQQSYKGLRVGDSRDKVYELYGEPTKSGYVSVMAKNKDEYYQRTADDQYSSPINFIVYSVNNTVTDIVIEIC